MDQLLQTAVEQGASDLHLSVGLPPVFRINGNLANSDYPILTSEGGKKLIYSILNDRQRERFENTMELDCSYGARGCGRFRVNVFRQRGAVGACLRVISSAIPNRTALGLPSIIDELVKRPSGLILVTGATGSGKSTTLACMLDLLNSTENRHIITIEDPIEYIHPHKLSMVNQREVGQDTRSWGDALKATLREDPDVIMVGEMRDAETVMATLGAAETGHLVFSTLHTRDAVETVCRVLDFFPGHQSSQILNQLSSVLEAILAQRLVTRIEKTGRAPAVEIMIANQPIRSMIRDGKTSQLYNAIQTGGKAGMQTMEQALLELIKTRQVTLEDALAHTTHVDELKRLASGVR